MSSVIAQNVLFRVALGFNMPTGWLLPLQSIPQVSATDNNTTDAHVAADFQAVSAASNSSQGDDKNSGAGSFSASANAEQMGFSDSEATQLKYIFTGLLCHVNKGLSSNPSSFVPAVRKFMNNTETYTATETGLLTALSTFGKYCGLTPSYRS